MKTKLNYSTLGFILSDLEWNQEVFLRVTFSGGYMKLTHVHLTQTAKKYEWNLST